MRPFSNTLRDSHFPRFSGPEPMVDFVAGFYTVHGPDGAKVNPANIPSLAGTRLLCGTEDFPASRWQSFRTGGTRTFVAFRRGMFWISGNPASVEGSNAFATISPDEAEGRWLALLLDRMGLGGYSLRFVRRTRLDITNQVDCESEEAAQATAICVRHTLSAPRKKSASVKETTYLSLKTHEWTLRVYSSAEKPGCMVPVQISDLPDIRHFLRFEVCIRGPELRKLGIDLRPLAEIDLLKEYTTKINQCRITPGNLRTPLEPPPGLMKDRRKENREHYVEWAKSTRSMKGILAESTYHRVRKRLLLEGFDIAFPPNLAPDVWEGVLRWEDIRHPSRWFATRFELADVVMNRLRRDLNESMRHRQGRLKQVQQSIGDSGEKPSGAVPARKTAAPKPRASGKGASDRVILPEARGRIVQASPIIAKP